MNKKLAALKAEMQQESKSLMKEAFREFFLKYGEAVENIFWTQYTPHFNDGEACNFSVGDVWVTLKDDEEACDYEGSTIYSKENLETAKENYETVKTWLADKRAAALKYQSEYIKRYGRSPFQEDAYRRYGSGFKTSEQQMEEWMPVYGISTLEEAQEKIDTIEAFVVNYPDMESDFQQIKNFISSIDEDLMETMFGDHTKVIVTVNGIETEEYSHN